MAAPCSSASTASPQYNTIIVQHYIGRVFFRFLDCIPRGLEERLRTEMYSMKRRLISKIDRDVQESLSESLKSGIDLTPVACQMMIEKTLQEAQKVFAQLNKSDLLSPLRLEEYNALILQRNSSLRQLEKHIKKSQATADLSGILEELKTQIQGTEAEHKAKKTLLESSQAERQEISDKISELSQKKGGRQHDVNKPRIEALKKKRRTELNPLIEQTEREIKVLKEKLEHLRLQATNTQQKIDTFEACEQAFDASRIAVISWCTSLYNVGLERGVNQALVINAELPPDCYLALFGESKEIPVLKGGMALEKNGILHTLPAIAVPRKFTPFFCELRMINPNNEHLASCQFLFKPPLYAPTDGLETGEDVCGADPAMFIRLG